MLDQKDLATLSSLVKKVISTERNRFIRKLRRNEFESDGHQEWHESYIQYLMNLHEKLRVLQAELEEEEFAQKQHSI